MSLSSLTKHWKIILLMAGIFLAGLVGGSVLTAGVLGKVFSKVAVKILNMEGWSQRTARELEKRLELTPDQVRQINAIAEKYQPEVMATRNEAFDRLGGIYKRLNADIMPVLTPEQATRFQALSQRRAEQFRKTFRLHPIPSSATNAPAPALK